MMVGMHNFIRGFTLVEMLVVIVITGVISGMVAMFIRAPIHGYVDSARRAEMTDIADTALRRIGRDLRLALPNSVRVSGTNTIDFLATTGGGRYRAGAGGANNDLDFSVADTSFEVIGSMPILTAGDQIVVYNLSIPGADAYLNENRATYSSNAGGVIVFLGSKKFPFESPMRRFQVVHEQVRYICDLTTGNLMRYWGFPVQPPVAMVPMGGRSALLASHVSACSFNYDSNVVAQRYGLVTINLSITENGETITLYNAIHVSNVP